MPRQVIWHPIDEQIAALGDPSALEQSLEIVWLYYEAQNATTIQRPPSDEERDAVAAFLRQEGWAWLQNETGQAPGLSHPAVRLARDAGALMQSVSDTLCPHCRPLHLGAIHMSLNVDPWSSQVGFVRRRAIRAAVAKEVATRSFGAMLDEALCVQIAFIKPQKRRTIDVDNAVKDLLDELSGGVLWDNDRQIQCLSVRRIETTDPQGHYKITVRPVVPFQQHCIVPRLDAKHGTSRVSPALARRGVSRG
jgi:Endodeoxyribonuclease RusA